jgi:ketosteroid isomerase-like protein
LTTASDDALDTTPPVEPSEAKKGAVRSSSARILSLEAIRCRALQIRDTARLAELLDPGFVYVHASGRIEQRAPYLYSVADPVTTYGHFAHRDVDIRFMGACALMSGVLSHTKSVRGDARILQFRFTAAWTADDAGEWRLVRWHNTRILARPRPHSSAPRPHSDSPHFETDRSPKI